METIDITPTWQAALQIYLMALENGNKTGKASAIEGLKQMADVAQAYAEQHKKKKTEKPRLTEEEKLQIVQQDIKNLKKSIGQIDTNFVCNSPNLERLFDELEKADQYITPRLKGD